jgi:N-acetylglucosamine-6-phosphate deacetylase
MDRAVRNAMQFMRAPLQDAVRMASETPAEILNMPRKGRIRLGADADLVVLSADCTVVETIVAGEAVYHGKG